MKLHRMTWREFQKHNSAAIGHIGNLDQVIPETYWFESNGEWFSVDKGAVGWNIYDESWTNVGYAETLKELRNDSMFC
jgi:hypothetical protein